MGTVIPDMTDRPTVNPDAQQTVTEFLDYTEYLPADLVRSLTLIRQLDTTYHTHADEIHNLTRTYGSLPTIASNLRPDARDLRHSISQHLDLALNARESSYAEAVRLADLTDRHQDRLESIVAKLRALPKPPSRDPTPQPTSTSASKRSRSGRKLDGGVKRLTLKAPKSATISAIQPNAAHHRVTIPGDVLPPFDPDEPIASTEVSEWEGETLSSPPQQTLKLTQFKVQKQRATPSHEVERKSREARDSSTYKKPTPPPADAQPGSRYFPWTELGEYEMYKLRKKMKKNHTWDPSDVMIKRELLEKGRGWDNYLKAKAVAEKDGTPFNYMRGAERPVMQPALSFDTPSLASTTASVVTKEEMKKSQRKAEAKDRKKEVTTSTALTPAQQTDQIAQRMSILGSTFKTLFGNAISGLTGTSSTPPSAQRDAAKRSSKKRKAEEVEPDRVIKIPRTIVPKPRSREVPIAPAPPAANVPPASAGTIRIPLKLQLTSPSYPGGLTLRPPTTSGPSSAPGRASTIGPDTTPSVSSRPSPRQSAGGSVEPSSATARSRGRTSTTPLTGPRKASGWENTGPAGPSSTASGRARRGPGTVTQSSQDGGAAISMSKRRSKPSSKTGRVAAPRLCLSLANTPGPEIRTDVDGNTEVVDPDEERYCICNDVSWGQMIQCEVDEKVRRYDATGRLVANGWHSAHRGRGSISTASIWLTSPVARSNGIARLIARSTTEARRTTGSMTVEICCERGNP